MRASCQFSFLIQIEKGHKRENQLESKAKLIQSNLESCRRYFWYFELNEHAKFIQLQNFLAISLAALSLSPISCLTFWSPAQIDVSNNLKCLPFSPGAPQIGLQLAAVHVLHNDEDWLLFDAAAQQADHVDVWLQCLHYLFQNWHWFR